ncbi:radical SAM protein [bacterium]|nr:radical SAM protein [bacterium]
MILKDYLKTVDKVYHTTLNPKGPGSVRIHLVPPKNTRVGIPWVTIINGYYILPIQTSWAVLLSIFIEELNKTNGVPFESMDEIIENTITKAKEIFFNTEAKLMKKDLSEILKVFEDIARGKNPTSEIGFMTLSKYSKFMGAPHRMDLMVSSMNSGGIWNCNQECIHCYAGEEIMANTDELSTADWLKIIDNLKLARVPMVTFTGGEPTMRDDLVDLVEHADWFVTRLNTNGILMTKDLAEKLYKASLDNVQFTFYSVDKDIHNLLVGGKHFDETIEGIKNAINAGLDVSVNTPLCSINKNYKDTIEFLMTLGVKYFTCSGLIPSGKALEIESTSTRLSKKEITNIVKEAYKFTSENGLELSFTSPGWIDDKDLKSMRMVVPSCGACLSNMAIAPNGDVLPCQSWLQGETLGNILELSWNKIWNSKMCKSQRKYSAKNERICPLGLKEANV